MSVKALHSHEDDDFDYEDEHIERESENQEYEALADSEFNSRAAQGMELLAATLTSPTVAPSQIQQDISSPTVVPARRRQKRPRAATNVTQVPPPVLTPPVSRVVSEKKQIKRPSPLISKPKRTTAEATTKKPHSPVLKSKRTNLAKTRAAGAKPAPKSNVRKKISSKAASQKKSASVHGKKR